MDNPSSPPGPLRTCPSCGSPVEPGHKFCEICGAKVPDLPVCKKCGAQFIAPVKFCELCGTPVGAQEKSRLEEPPAPEHVPETEPVREPEPARKPEPEPQPEMEPEPVVRKPAPAPVPAPSKKPAYDLIKDTLPETEPAAAKTPAKPPVNKALIIGGIVILLVIIAAAYFVGLPMLKGGGPGVPAAVPTATSAMTMPPAPATTPAPAPQAPKVTVPPTPAYSLVPEPTQIMPKNQEVFFDVQKDQVNAKITVLFQSGPGINLISAGDVKVTHPDGTIVTGTLKPSQGVTEIVLEGSKGTDRIEVIAKMYNGQSYRVKDQLLTFKTM
jgi:hypothetical protein